ncbi:MAG: UvrD-helicase domain-containing protein [Clostridia bacterium]|nr:UvrD-helicase domain-containing protein [Clostridia bacterium]
MDYSALLNEEQLKPVLDTEGAVLVLAGAGSGKTRVLTHRIAYLMENCGVNPYNILAITFTNKAAREMRERISTMVEGADLLSMSTFHSFCAKVLRVHADKLGYSADYSIYTDSDLDRVYKQIFEDRRIDDGELKDACKYHVSNAKNLALSPDEYKIQYDYISNISQIVEVYRQYDRELKRANAMDFDDLLLNALRLFRQFDDVRLSYAMRYRYVMVDEFQDTNATQYDLVRLLSSYHHNVFVVGDDDQSIYGWRGADISNILDFKRDYPLVKTYKLERNYRSTPQILEVANSIISTNTNRTGKTLWTANPQGVKVELYGANSDRDEAEYVAQRILDLMRYSGYNPSEIAVLVRVNAITRSFEEKFNLYNLPYRIYGGFRFFERKEIKDIISYLRLVLNPRDDESLKRIINFPRRGIGESTIDKLVEYRGDSVESLFDVILDVDKVGLSSTIATKIKGFASLMLDLIKSKETMDVVEFVKYVVDRVGIMDAYKSDSEEDYSRRLNISEFLGAVDEFVKDNEGATLSDYMQNVSLISDLDADDTQEKVTISTVHMVKGLEFKVVFVVGMEEGIFPISRAIDDPKEMEEERRVMYVAVTRAMQRLYITWASSRFRFGTVKSNIPSRFMDDVPGFRRPQRRTIEDSYAGYRGGLSYADSDDTDTYPKRTGYSAILSNVATTIPTPSATRSNTSETKDYSGFKPGVKVVHAKFGEGTIVDVRGEGKSRVCKIAFAGLGIKAFTLEVAPISIKR